MLHGSCSSFSSLEAQTAQDPITTPLATELASTSFATISSMTSTSEHCYAATSSDCENNQCGDHDDHDDHPIRPPQDIEFQRSDASSDEESAASFEDESLASSIIFPNDNSAGARGGHGHNNSSSLFMNRLEKMIASAQCNNFEVERKTDDDASSLVEKSSLIQSVTWLSHHVPECVLKYLFDTILQAREDRQSCRRHNSSRHPSKHSSSSRYGTAKRSACNLCSSHSRRGRRRGSVDSQSRKRNDRLSIANRCQRDSFGNNHTDNRKAERQTAPDFNPRASGASFASDIPKDIHIGNSPPSSPPSSPSHSSSPPNSFVQPTMFYSPKRVTTTSQNNIHNNPNNTIHPPITTSHRSAILFVDISGFTKIATSMDVESLSNAINSYFQMIVNEITSYGGDVLKFAGDAIFAEWQVSRQMGSRHNLEYCVSLAASCAASIVANCSDYAVVSNPIGGLSRRSSMRSVLSSSMRPSFSRSSSVKSSVIGDDAFLHSSQISHHGTESTVDGDDGQRQRLSRRSSFHSSMVSMRSSMKSVRSSLVTSGDCSSPLITSSHQLSPQEGDEEQSFVPKQIVPRRPSTIKPPINLSLQTAATATDSTLRSSQLTIDGGESVGGGHWVEQDTFARRGGRRASLDERLSTILSSRMATLNVKCGLGAGHVVGIHVGDDVYRREYLILGDTIDQVSKAESAASHGEVFASPEATKYLAKACTMQGDWEEYVRDQRPIRIADHDTRYFESNNRRASHRESIMSCEFGSMLRDCDELDTSELLWLKQMISLYVHPVIVNDENERTATLMRRESDYERHLDEAELRNVYTCFIRPLIDHKLTGDEIKDGKLFNLLNDVMNLTTRELDKVQGHLRQFILDDKGLVLICTFGLRGSTFLNMIAQRAVPFSLSIHKALEEELRVKSSIGATFGKAYCGVIGGLERHEFAVLGPSVNLSARLMASKDNPGILVDENVRLLTSQIFFKPLPAVKAKGYDELVPIFEPIQIADNKWGQVNKIFVGRANEIKKIMHVANEMVLGGTVSKFLFLSAISGAGKSALIARTTEHVQSMMMKMNKRAIISRNASHDGDSRIPFSLFRSIFRDVLSQVHQEDDESQAPKRNSSSVVDFSIDGQWDNLSLHSQSSKSSMFSTDVARFRYLCQELNAPLEFVQVVGKRLLGLRDANSSAACGKGPNLQKIVDLMTDAFIRCTRHTDLVFLALDDAQWMDEMSWKVVQGIFERGENVLILCGSRPPSSNPLSVDPSFWSDLQGQYETAGRYTELSLAPFCRSEVQEMIGTTLESEVNEIDQSFSRDIFKTSGGMPHFLTHLLDVIKRSKLTGRLENGLIGMKNFTGEDSKLGSGSVRELLLFRLDALDSSVRFVLHISAVLGTEFDLLDAALAYEEMFGVEHSDRLDAAVALRELFDIAIQEGIIEQSLVFGEDDDFEEIEMIEEDLCLSPRNATMSSKRRKAHPFYAENCRLRFTHDSWKASILDVMLDERIQEMHEYVAMSLEKDLDEKTDNKDDFEKRIRVLKHWTSCGNFMKAAILALDVGGQLMLLGLNSQAILLFDDVLNILKEITDDESEVTHGGISISVLEAIDSPELEFLIKLNISKGKAYSALRRVVDSAEAYHSALDILQNTPCSEDEEFDRMVSFPIFSGLFALLKAGVIEQDNDCSYENDLCKKFFQHVCLNRDPMYDGHLFPFLKRQSF